MRVKPMPLTMAQQDTILNAARDEGISFDELTSYIVRTWRKSLLRELTIVEAGQLVIDIRGGKVKKKEDEA